MADLLDTLRALVDGLTAQTRLHVPVRYRVVSVNPVDNRVNLQAVKKGPWPDILPTSTRAGVPGVEAKLTQGSICLVAFIEGNASMPVITHFSTTEESGWAPLSLRFDATTEVVIGDPVTSVGRQAARVGDTAGPFLISSGSLKTRIE